MERSPSWRKRAGARDGFSAAVATSAVREASNRAALVRTIRERTELAWR